MWTDGRLNRTARGRKIINQVNACEHAGGSKIHDVFQVKGWN